MAAAAAPWLVLRADADGEIGSGHVLRCLALAQAWMDSGGTAAIATGFGSEPFRNRLSSEGLSVHDISAGRGTPEDAALTARLADDLGARWVVVDGYGFGLDYQRRLRDEGFRLLLIDDGLHTGENAAHIVVNTNVYASADLYADGRSDLQLLIGTRFALLRREFSRREPRPKVMRRATRVLVTTGGADAAHAAAKVMEALRLVDTRLLEVRVVVGPASTDGARLEELARRLPTSASVETNPSDMADLMDWADIAVASAGTTAMELCYMGVPAILLVTADNQEAVAQGLEEAGAAINGGRSVFTDAWALAGQIDRLLQSREARSRMSEQARALVDGRGAARVVAAVRHHSLRLRPVVVADAELLLRWTNDPAVRDASFQTEPVEWDNHLRWLQAKLSDPGSFLCLAIDEHETPIGVMRFDVEGPDAVISGSIDYQFRGIGLAPRLIRMACAALFAERESTTVHAYIKQSNTASVRAFERAGFRDVPLEELPRDASVHLVLRRGRS